MENPDTWGRAENILYEAYQKWTRTASAGNFSAGLSIIRTMTDALRAEGLLREDSPAVKLNDLTDPDEIAAELQAKWEQRPGNVPEPAAKPVVTEDTDKVSFASMRDDAEMEVSEGLASTATQRKAERVVKQSAGYPKRLRNAHKPSARSASAPA